MSKVIVAIGDIPKIGTLIPPQTWNTAERVFRACPETSGSTYLSYNADSDLPLVLTWVVPMLYRFVVSVSETEICVDNGAVKKFDHSEESIQAVVKLFVVHYFRQK